MYTARGLSRRSRDVYTTVEGWKKIFTSMCSPTCSVNLFGSLEYLVGCCKIFLVLSAITMAIFAYVLEEEMNLWKGSDPINLVCPIVPNIKLKAALTKLY